MIRSWPQRLGWGGGNPGWGLGCLTQLGLPPICETEAASPSFRNGLDSKAPQGSGLGGHKITAGYLPKEFLALVVVGPGEGAADTRSCAKEQPKKLAKEVVKARRSGRNRREQEKLKELRTKPPGRGPLATGGMKKSGPSKPFLCLERWGRFIPFLRKHLGSLPQHLLPPKSRT